MNKRIAVLPGDGIGPEVTAVAVQVLKKIAVVFNHQFEFEEGLVGAIAIDETGNPFPEATLQLCQSADAILFGAIGHPKYDNDPTATVRPEQGLLAMRKALGLYANIRPVNTFKALADASPLKREIVEGVDFVVFRELTGGSYTHDEILRITELAFEAAAKRRKKVTLVDKANVMETSRLWREVVQKYAADFPEIELELMFVDNAAMALIQNPRRFDVILTENMFGDILTDEASVITGSLGMLPSASVGSEVALYEPIHGSYPQAAGQNIANPMAAVLSAATLLETSFNLMAEGKTIRHAVEEALNFGYVTKDINSDKFMSTTEVGQKICDFI